MAINLAKKQSFDLTKKTGASKILVGLSWDSVPVNGRPVDCDASVVMLGEDYKIPSEGFFVFYNNLTSSDGAVRHFGDNTDGSGDGDDEVVEIDLGRVSSQVASIMFAVTIHEAEARGHNFGHVSTASIRIFKDAELLCTYQMADGNSGDDSVIIGQLLRDGSDWRFETLGSGFSGGLEKVVELYA